MRFLPVRARIPWRSAPPRDRHGCPLGKPHPIMSTLSPSALRYFAPRNPTLIAWNKTSHTGHQRSSRMQASLPSTIFPIPVRIAWYKQRNSPSNYAREWPAQHQEASSAEVHQGPGRPHACGWSSPRLRRWPRVSWRSMLTAGLTGQDILSSRGSPWTWPAGRRQKIWMSRRSRKP
jgi:hypothetical protein